MENKTTLDDQPTNKVLTRDERGRYIKGHSGNPYANGGRPFGSISLVTKLKDRLVEHPEEADKIVDTLITLGLKPNSKQLEAIKETFDRVDGKSLETKRIEGELPISIVFIPAKELLERQSLAMDNKEGDALDVGYKDITSKDEPSP